MRISTIMSLFLGILTTAGLAQPIGRLQVGAAKVDITPPQDLLVSPQEESRGFVGVHEHIYVRTIVLDNGLEQAVIVAINLIRVPNQLELTRRITDTIGCAPEHVMLASTHNHCVPREGRIGEQTNPKSVACFAMVKKKVLKVVREAKASLQPARIGFFGRDKVYINTNRDEMVGDRCRLGVNPNGPSDKSVDVIKFEALSGEPIAMFINYGVHAVVNISCAICTFRGHIRRQKI